MLITTLMLIPITIMPYLIGMARLPYLIGAIALNIWFLWSEKDFVKTQNTQTAKRVLKASVFYLMLLLALIIVDSMFIPRIMR